MPDRAAAVALARRYVAAERSEASLAVLTDAQGLEASLDMLLDEALTGDLVRREAALSLIGCREARGLPERLVAAGEQAGPEALASLVALLGRRGEASAREFVRRQLTHESPAVREAAIGALPGFGVEAAVADLVSALVTCRPEDVPAYRRTLAWQQSERFAEVVAAGVPRASGAAKVALLELLALRRAQAQAEVAFAALGDGEAAVRRAALKALETPTVSPFGQASLESRSAGFSPHVSTNASSLISFSSPILPRSTSEEPEKDTPSRLNILLYGKYVCFLSSTLHASVAFAATEHMRMPLPSVASSYLAPAVTSTPSTMITSGVSSSPRQHIIRGEAQDDVVPAEVKCEVFGDRYGHLLDRRWGSLLGGIYP